MKLRKTKSHYLEKSYCVAPLHYNGADCLLVAAEKQNKCLLFDLEGNLLETVWEKPGGTMSIAQIPSSNGCFLATQRFYSPNDSAAAEIVYVSPNGKNGWQVRPVAQLPFVHRFDILERGGQQYVVACTLKSAHNHKDDWSAPGKIWVAELPTDIDMKDADTNPLQFTVLQDGLTKNHGFCHIRNESGSSALVGAEEGVFRVTPPDLPGAAWSVEQLISDPCSDMMMADLDGDGQPELITISPFHGDTLKIYRLSSNNYLPVYICPQPVEFAHALWSGEVNGETVALLGYRKGEQAILAFRFLDGAYQYQILDTNAGSANMMVYHRGNQPCLLSANREKDEIAFYDIEV